MNQGTNKVRGKEIQGTNDEAPWSVEPSVRGTNDEDEFKSHGLSTIDHGLFFTVVCRPWTYSMFMFFNNLLELFHTHLLILHRYSFFYVFQYFFISKLIVKLHEILTVFV